MDEVSVLSDRSTTSAAITVPSPPAPLPLDPSRRFVLAWKLMSKLVDAMEGPPERLARRLVVLRDINEAWGSSREVAVVIQDSRHGSGSRFDISDVREDMCNHRSQLGLDKINIEAAHPSDEKLPAAGDDVGSNDAVEEDGPVAWSELWGDLSNEMGDDSAGDQAHEQEEHSAIDGGAADQPPWSAKGANNQQSPTQTRPFGAENRRKPYCKKCDQYFHLGEFSSDRPFACPRCRPSTTKPCSVQEAACSSNGTPALAVTGINATSSSRRRFPCRKCPKRFIRKSHLEEHIRRHNNEKPFFCVCGKSFCTRGGLNSHKKIHFRETTRQIGRASNTGRRRSARFSKGPVSNLKSPKAKEPNMIEQVREEAADPQLSP